MAKLDKKAHARALKLHHQHLETDPEYRAAWDNLVIQMFSDLADAKLPDEPTSSVTSNTRGSE